MRNDSRTSDRIGTRPATRRLRAVAAALAALPVLAACDGLLEVSLPGELTTDDVFLPQMAEAAINGAIANYECGFSNMGASASGMESVYWRATGFFSNYAEFAVTRVGGGGTCNGSNTDASSWYMMYQGSRHLAETTYGHLAEWTNEEVPNRERLMATAATYTGLSYQMFGEVFCEMAVDVGPLMTPTETLQKAETWFDRAIEHVTAAGDFGTPTTPSVLQLAHLGRARVRLALGDLPGAAEDARVVQPDFVALVTRDGSVRARWNKFYDAHNTNRMGTIADVQSHLEKGIEIVPFTGYRDLTIDALGRSQVDGIAVRGDGEPDPRVPVVIVPGAVTSVGALPIYIQQKYTSIAAPQAMARWAEAQLILAEIEGGQQAVDRINALRDVHGLPHYRGGSAEDVRNTIIEERRREFFLENRHWADKLRYDLWFPRGVGQARPMHYAFGPVTCILMPETEYTNNPNATGDGSQFHQY